MLSSHIIDKLCSGYVIPAHPLALKQDGNIDERSQKALTRYYIDSGAGGLAVGVHTTQFAIHDPKVGLYKPVLELAAETSRKFAESTDCDEPIMIAGILGDTKNAVKEAQLAVETGYHIGLISLTALKGKSINELIDHAKQVAEVIPIMGFYLQEVISEMLLPMEFWRKFVEIPNVQAIKIAPFNRYQTLDVLEAVAHSGRSDEIALYTGNDDNIICDLLTRYEFNVDGHPVSLRIVGGLLGQWACWTKRAVEYLTRIKTICESERAIPQDMLTLANQLTLANKAIFDADNHFTGCIPGISYILKQQGFLEHIGTLDPDEQLSEGQAEMIDRIRASYPHLTDDDFVKENLHKWLSS
ncbi:MAG: dihydrodipicolinate synthase family protein [Planctomycetes bacterium]|nr:dihydrodipicolinate synthase family protein [Planctomycetota bacterium]MBL7142611.1 dihydrodipicolinate synthase family protein [Phycisphaerae bacterium]